MYNGYKNWETWNVVLWVFNDEANYRDYLQYKSGMGTFSALEAKQYLNNLFINGTPDMDNPSELNAVDWQEVADALNEE